MKPVNDAFNSQIAVEQYTTEIASLRDKVQQRKDRIAWFECQVFGRKSEKRVDHPHKVSLLTEPTVTPPETQSKASVTSYQRGKGSKQHTEDYTEALEQIGQLDHAEDAIRANDLSEDKKRQYRFAHSKPIVDQFFAWCRAQCQRSDLTPSHPLTKALKYVMNHENALRVFLEDPAVPLDTNHLEREIRPIPLWRKNWMFCWTELGTEHAGLIQSLICTCKLHDINPYTYLVDVLQRISEHPADRVVELTPRLWKQQFAEAPLRSPLDQVAGAGRAH